MATQPCNPAGPVLLPHGLDRSRSGPPSCEAMLALPRRWRSSELLGNLHEIEIEHGAALYRLRLTSLGKLILTK
jgi:hemin uptake protein HemP